MMRRYTGIIRASLPLTIFVKSHVKQCDLIADRIYKNKGFRGKGQYDYSLNDTIHSLSIIKNLIHPAMNKSV